MVRPARRDVDRAGRAAYDLLTMTSKVLSDVLTRHGKGAQEGQIVRLQQDTEVTVFASIGQECLAIERVAEFNLEHEVVVLTTRRSEHYVLAYEDVRSIRFASASGSKPAFL